MSWQRISLHQINPSLAARQMIHVRLHIRPCFVMRQLQESASPLKTLPVDKSEVSKTNCLVLLSVSAIEWKFVSMHSCTQVFCCWYHSQRTCMIWVCVPWGVDCEGSLPVHFILLLPIRVSRHGLWEMLHAEITAWLCCCCKISIFSSFP